MNIHVLVQKQKEIVEVKFKMKCVKGCYFLEKGFKEFYCGLYDEYLIEENSEVIRCQECENKETVYYTRIKNAKNRMDNVKEIEGRR